MAGQWQCDGSGSAGMEIEEASVNGDEALEFLEQPWPRVARLRWPFGLSYSGSWPSSTHRVDPRVMGSYAHATGASPERR